MRDIKQLHPRLQILADQLVKKCAEQGLTIKIGECYRTVAEQEELYAQGRTKPGNIVTNARGTSYSSQHQWGIAFDFYLQMDVDHDGKISDDAYNDSTGLFKKAADIGKGLGLGWGGDWKSIVDKPHLYLPEWGSTTAKLKKEFGTPEKFMQTWIKATDVPGWVKDEHGYWYRREDGSWPTMCWELINHHWYLFGKSGYMITGWVQWDGQRTGAGEWYYLEEDGEYAGACWHGLPNGAMERWYVA